MLQKLSYTTSIGYGTVLPSSRDARSSPVTGKSVKEGAMPKEMIEGAWFGKYARSHDTCTHGSDWGDCPGKEVPLDSSAVKVGWSKEAGHVEMAVVQCIDGVFVEHGFQAGDYEDVNPPQYIQLDRRGINRLIRQLRKARDDAYGKDA